jgi:hypothetical protein
LLYSGGLGLLQATPRPRPRLKQNLFFIPKLIINYIFHQYNLWFPLFYLFNTCTEYTATNSP